MTFRRYGARHAALLALAALIALEQILLPGGTVRHLSNIVMLIVVAGLATYLVARWALGSGGRQR